MKRRNMENIISKRHGNIPSAYDLSLEDAQELYRMSQSDDDELVKVDRWELVTNAFIYGYEMGVRASKRNHTNKRKD